MPAVLLCGFWPHVTAQVAGQLLADNRSRRHLHYEAPRPESLTRAGAGEIPVGALVRDLATAGRDQAGLLVTVPEGYEPDQIRTAWRQHTGGGALPVITVVPADLLLDGLTDETALRAVDLHVAATDDRSVGDLVARQIEQADTVLLVGEPDDQWEADQLRVLLHRIAPWSQHRSLDDVCLTAAGRTEPVAPITRGLHGRAVGVHEPLPDHGVVAWVFHARRPFHPARLHDALDEITDGVLRSRGHFWLAGHPGLVMTWESAGGLSLGPHSGWLADLPGEHWDAVDPERRLAAAVDWDPYYGDRHQHLAFVGLDADPVHVHHTLAGCLLTDDELADGAEAWAKLPDPFARCFRLATTQENQT